MRSILILTVAVLLIAAACSSDDDTSVATDPGEGSGETGSDDGGPDAGGTDIQGSWTLVMLVEEGDMAIPLPEDATIDLRIDDSEVGGTAACNSYGGSVEIGEDGSFVASDLFQTEMACEPPELMEMETRYLTALDAATAWMIEDGRLTLTGPDAVLVFERTPDPVDAALETTVWQLDSFYDGTGPDGSVTNQLGMEAVALTISADAATLESPCGSASGTVESDADGQGSIRVMLTLTDEQCSDEERVLIDDALARLGRADRYQIEASRLTLSSGEDPVIGFTAR
jgi:heat shock protein HslJ